MSEKHGVCCHCTENVKEHPILFSGAMVRAGRDGTKTQTRRVSGLEFVNGTSKKWKYPPCAYRYWGLDETDGAHVFNRLGTALSEAESKNGETLALKSPYAVGDRLWVREAYRFGRGYNGLKPSEVPTYAEAHYEADGDAPDWAGTLRPAIHMPRWASRITLEVMAVRVERLQDITEEDATAEGYAYNGKCAGCNRQCAKGCWPPIRWFCALWNIIYASRGLGWDANPWVFAYTFKVVDKAEAAVGP